MREEKRIDYVEIPVTDPGGKRFRFVDPVATEYAIWSSDTEEA